jgi:hypothetical protein
LCFPLNIKKRRIKENGMGGAYSARKKWEMHVQFQLESLKEEVT